MVRRSTLLLFTLVSCSVVESAVRTLSTDLQVGMAIAHPPTLVAQATTTSELYIGLRGAAVETLQTQLQEQGVYDGPTDGFFGLSTKEAVLDFQASAGIESTGRWDEASRQALQAALGSAEESDTVNISTEEFLGNEPAEDTPSESESAGESSSEDEALDSGTPSAIAANPENQSTGKNSRFTKLLLSGLGLFAVAGSFGAGFFAATRTRKESAPSAENWLSVTDSSDSLPNDSDHTAPSSAVGSKNSSGYRPDQVGHSWTRDDDETVGELVSALRTSSSQGRRQAIWELGQHGHSLAVQPLVDLMTEVDSKEKSLIIAALSEIGMRSLRPLSHALANAIQDDNREVRKNAIRDLSRIYDLVIQVSQLLGHAVKDDDADVRQTARWALDQLNRIRQPHEYGSNGFTSSGVVPISSNTIEFETSDFDTQQHQLQS